jgi:hypothetical protein
VVAGDPDPRRRGGHDSLQARLTKHPILPTPKDS